MKRRSPHTGRALPAKLVTLSLALAAVGCNAVGDEEPIDEVRSAVTANVSIVGRIAMPGLLATPASRLR